MEIHPPRRLPPRRAGTMLIAIGLGAAVLVGCGDDDGDEASPQDDYCAAAEELQTSVGSLTDLDVVAEGTNGLESAVNDVRDDVTELRDSAGEAAGDELDALGQSIDDLQSSLSDLGGDITAENAGAVVTAVQAVGTAAQAVQDTLTDCP